MSKVDARRDAVAAAYAQEWRRPTISWEWYTYIIADRASVPDKSADYWLRDHLQRLRRYSHRRQFAKPIELDAPEDRDVWHEFSIGQHGAA